MFHLSRSVALACLAAGLAATPAMARGDRDLQQVAGQISAGDFANAEARIAAMGPAARNDPAMLINLGNAYAGQGRRAEAIAAFQAAIKADPEAEFDMADGSVRTVREIAGDAIRMLGTAYASR